MYIPVFFYKRKINMNSSSSKFFFNTYECFHVYRPISIANEL